MMYRDSEVTHFTKMSVAENKLVGNLFVWEAFFL